MKNSTIKLIGIIFCLFGLGYNCTAQEVLTSQMLEKSAYRFSLTQDNLMESMDQDKWLDWIGGNQFVGLAEVHNSAQLSFFTKALLNVLDQKGFEDCALEMGPTSASILDRIIKNSAKPLEDLRLLNRKYGKNSSIKTPMIFANKVEDVVFLEAAGKLKFNLLGIDQEFAYSYEMLLDHLYELFKQKSDAFKDAYQKAKSAINKVIFKNKHQGQPANCWLLENEDMNQFFNFYKEDSHQKIIKDIKKSWEIYCEYHKGGSNQLRANYMKNNIDNFFSRNELKTKLFLKLGGVHLTRGKSPFKVDDVGKYLTEKAIENKTGFLTIRHLIPYRKGKSNIGKSGWKSVTMFLELGRKDQWTVVDLRPFREMLLQGKITTNKKFEFELKSYDLLLLSPDDQYPEVNY